MKSLDDLADLAADELVELLPEAQLTEADAGELIMAARAHWFGDEAAGEPRLTARPPRARRPAGRRRAGGARASERARGGGAEPWREPVERRRSAAAWSPVRSRARSR